jgi:hypothetical protein
MPPHKDHFCCVNGPCILKKHGTSPQHEEMHNKIVFQILNQRGSAMNCDARLASSYYKIQVRQINHQNWFKRCPKISSDNEQQAQTQLHQ